MTKRVWTISNGLSIIRVLLVIPIVLFLESPDPTARQVSLALILIATATDLLDGWLARKLNQVSDIGKILDPLADKIIVAAVIITLVLRGSVPVWYFIFVLVRDIVIFAGGIYVRRSRGILLQSNVTGKWAVSSVAIYIFIVVANRTELVLVQDIFLIASAGLLLISFVLYFRRYRNLVQSSPLLPDLLNKNVL